MPLASENERHGTRDTGIDGGFLSVRIYSAKNRKAWFLPSRNFSVGQSPTLQRLTKLDGASPNAPKKFWQCWGAHLLMCRKFFGSAGALPSKTTCHSLLAIRHSLFATSPITHWQICDEPAVAFFDGEKPKSHGSLAVGKFSVEEGDAGVKPIFA
jgi:hypothetical protein